LDTILFLCQNPNDVFIYFKIIYKILIFHFLKTKILKKNFKKFIQFSILGFLGFTH